MDIIDRINLCLAEIGKNGAEMSRDLGFSNSAYSQWNTHKYQPSKRSLAKMAPYLQTTVEYLMYGKEKTATPEGDGMSDKDAKFLAWFRSLPIETQKSILYDANAPEGLV